MIVTGIEGDARLGLGSISSSNLALVSLSGFTVSSIDVGKRISVAGAGPSGATLQAEITGAPTSTSVAITPSASGAVADAKVLLGTDNAPIIQNAIDNNRVVELPEVAEFACSNLDLTSPSCYALIGKGSAFARTTWMYPFSDSGTFLDWGGRSAIRCEGFMFGNIANPNKPDVGLLIGGAAAGNVDHIYLKNLGGTGHFRKATFVPHSGTGRIDACTFWNFESGGYGWAWDLDNSLGCSSAGGGLSNVYAASPWLVTGCEAHAGVSGARAMLWRGADDVAWIGGIISGVPGQDGLVIVANTNGGWNGMRRCSFQGVRFEGEGGAVANIFKVNSYNSGGPDYLSANVLGQNMYGATGDIVTGSAATNFRANMTGLPRN